MAIEIKPLEAEHADFLRDESRRTGRANAICFPRSEADVIDALRAVAAQGGTLTVQGARTGITAGAVPNGGTVLNLSRMNGIGEVGMDEGSESLTVQPGALLDDIREAAAARGLCFPPDPTESSASIGGMVACNASGAMSFHYGPTRKWVRGLRVVLADGNVLSLERGAQKADGHALRAVTDSGAVIAGTLPDIVMPNVKSAAGYFVRQDMDLLDLFIGMEGTLGIVTEIQLKLAERPAATIGLTAFLPSQDAAITFVRRMRECDPPPVAIEFFDCDALNLLRSARETHGGFSELPPLPAQAHTAIYIERHGSDEEALEELAMAAIETADDLGASEDDTWCATTSGEMEKLKAFRHATPEAVNLLIDERRKTFPDLTKLGTDMSVPDSELENVMQLYRDGLESAGLESVIFGHIGNNHVHVNIIPRDMDDYAAGKALYLDWARAVITMGGSVSAEHGIGKLKVPFLQLMLGDNGIQQMQELKAQFDPKAVLNRGNLF